MDHTVSLRFSTNILRRLGEELNPSVEHGIIELVKNSYDADATQCVVELRNVEQPGGCVMVVDDGKGMDADTIESGWLVLGSSKKQKHEPTALGRVPVGNKGLGRLAALRLGHSAFLETSPDTSKVDVHRLEIDWRAYEAAEVVDDVKLAIATAAVRSGREAGTKIELRGLRSKIGRVAVKRLARAMLLLADPFGDDPQGFHPRLVAPEYRDLEQLVSGGYFEAAEYRLSATLRDGRTQALLRDWRGETLHHGDHAGVASKSWKGGYGAPDADFDLWVYILSKETFSTRASTVGEVKAWLSAFGGVHLYENGVRVAPYGDPGNDWLDLNLARVRSPELRPSTNTSIGRVSVRDLTGRLRQKTDRSGYVADDNFLALKAFAIDALNWMAKRRLEMRQKAREAEKKRTRTRKRKATEDLGRLIEGIAEPAVRKRIAGAFEENERAHRKEVKKLTEEVQLYRTLATTGITAATFAHESAGGPLKSLDTTVDTLARRLGNAVPQDVYLRKFDKPIRRVKHTLAGLGVLGAVTLRLVERDKRRREVVDVRAVADDLLATLSPLLSLRNVSASIEAGDGSFRAFASRASVESILTNLINNALKAFDSHHVPERVIAIGLDGGEEDLFSLTVDDSGPGIDTDSISVEDIWLPGQTTNSDGTGLGLAIVRDTIADLDGTVVVVESGPLGGARFVISLPRYGA